MTAKPSDTTITVDMGATCGECGEYGPQRPADHQAALEALRDLVAAWRAGPGASAITPKIIRAADAVLDKAGFR